MGNNRKLLRPRQQCKYPMLEQPNVLLRFHSPSRHINYSRLQKGDLIKKFSSPWKKKKQHLSLKIYLMSDFYTETLQTNEWQEVFTIPKEKRTVVFFHRICIQQRLQLDMKPGKGMKDHISKI